MIDASFFLIFKPSFFLPFYIQFSFTTLNLIYIKVFNQGEPGTSWLVYFYLV